MKRTREIQWAGKSKPKAMAALVFLILGVCLYAQEQTGKIRFKHLSVIDGLSQEVVNCIIQDRKGFMWFGTQDGLNRYDGYNFKIYKNIPNDESSISDKYILCLYVDRDGALWVGTKNGGLHRYNRDSDNFSTFIDNPTGADILRNYDVKTIGEGPNGDLYVGTQGGGLLRMDKKTNKFKGYTTMNDLHDNDINVIVTDTNGWIWIGTKKGLDCFGQTKEKFSHYEIEVPGAKRFTGNNVTAICEVSKGCHWIGTEEGKLYRLDIEGRISPYKYSEIKSFNPAGYSPVRFLFKDGQGRLWAGTQKKLILFDLENGGVTEYENDISDSYSLSNNEVLSIYRDNTGIIWLGTYGGGLNIYEPSLNGFQLYNKERNNLSHNTIWAIHVDRQERLWVGTYEGLNLVDQKTGEFIAIPSLEKEDIRCIYEDISNEILWIGTLENGLIKFNPKTKQVENKYIYSENGLSDKAVVCILQTRPEEIWLGTFERGLNKFNPQTEEFFVYKSGKGDPNSLSNDRIRVILEDRDGKLWIGTDGGGVNLLTDPGKGIFKNYSHDKKYPLNLSHNRVKNIYQDRSGRIWVGLEGGGLNLLVDKEEGHFKSYGLLKPEVPNDTVYGILEDDQANLWISTNSGLFKFYLKINSVEKPSIKNYDLQDGLQSNEFDTGAYFRNESTGEMFFGGARGFNSFFPTDIKVDPKYPMVILSDFLLFNKSVEIQSTENNSPLKKAIDETESLTLTYKQSVLTFEFAALNYANPLKNRYKYIMEDYDEDWLETDAKNRRATYTSLPAGKYIFKVKGSNKNGVWNEEGKSIQLKILPPPWKTRWAYCLYCMAFIGIVLFLIRYQQRKAAKKNQAKEELEKKVIERTQFLEKIDDIVRTINAEIGFADLLRKILNETLVIKGVDTASALIWNPGENRFNVIEGVGWDIERLKEIKFTQEEAEARYINGTEMIDEDIYIVRDTKNRPYSDNIPPDMLPKSMLAMRIRLEDKTQAFFIFGNLDHENAFADQDIKLLEKLKGHIVEAFQKARLIHLLQEKNKELKETWEQLIQEEKLSSLGTLLAGIAHELLNPASTIMLNAEWFSRAWQDIAPLLERFDADKKLVIANLPYGESREEIEKLIAGLLDDSRRIKNLLEELNNFSRIDDGKSKETVDIHKVIRCTLDLTRNLIKKSTENFSLELGEKIPGFPGNSLRLTQVFIDLVRNACEALPDNTHGISISTSYLKKTDEILIQVKDEGEGIEEQYLRKITDPFFTTRRNTGGMGLGLSKSQKIIRDEHHGRIGVDSTPGQGTTVSVFLPVRPFNEKKNNKM